MPIRAALFDLGNSLIAYYQPSDFMPLLRRSLDACRRTLGHPPLSHEAQTALVHKALELNQERADLAVWPLEERLEMLGVPAKEAVFVGDDPVWDIEGADSAGLHPILLTNRAQQTNPTQVNVAGSLPEVLARIDQWNNSTANTGPRRALA